ncbi:MAG TPA: hypothetical protein DHV30_10465, partial [Balneola sp.]|nr:hypothetical protein [Balneola sp.]
KDGSAQHKVKNEHIHGAITGYISGGTVTHFSSRDDSHHQSDHQIDPTNSENNDPVSQLVFLLSIFSEKEKECCKGATDHQNNPEKGERQPKN